MEKIGHGQIIIKRNFSPEKWREFVDIDFSKNKYTYAIPVETELEISGLCLLDSPFDTEFLILSFELKTNFATADFSGRLSMGFAHVEESEKGIGFSFVAPFFPTNWTPEAVIKLNYIQKATGRQYTSYFKCKLSECRRDVYAGVGGDRKCCEFNIINPNSQTYQTSSQASLEGTSKVASIPTSKTYQIQSGSQGVTQENRAAAVKSCPNCRTDNPSDFLFCSNCGYSFSQAPVPQNPPQAPPQVASTTPPSVPQMPPQPPPQIVYMTPPAYQPAPMQFEPYEGPEKKRGCFQRFWWVLLILVVCLCLFLLMCGYYNGPGA